MLPSKTSCKPFQLLVMGSQEPLQTEQLNPSQKASRVCFKAKAHLPRYMLIPWFSSLFFPTVKNTLLYHSLTTHKIIPSAVLLLLTYCPQYFTLEIYAWRKKDTIIKDPKMTARSILLHCFLSLNPIKRESVLVLSLSLYICIFKGFYKGFNSQDSCWLYWKSYCLKTFC